MNKLLLPLLLLSSASAWADGIPTYPEYHWRLVAELEYVGTHNDLVHRDEFIRKMVARAPFNNIAYQTPNACAQAGEQEPWPLPMPAPKQGGELVQLIACIAYKTGEDTPNETPIL